MGMKLESKVVFEYTGTGLDIGILGGDGLGKLNVSPEMVAWEKDGKYSYVTMKNLIKFIESNNGQ